MKKKLSIAFIWHMHQPAYRTGPEEIYLMPWVRLHAVKDYLDMLVMMDKFPGLKLNFNLVPVLVDAIYNYGFRGAHDIYSKLTITPVEELGKEEKTFILNHFFDANYQNMVFHHAAYKKLYDKRFSRDDIGIEDFTPQEYSDIMAWFNLSWIDPHWRVYPKINELSEKTEGNFTLQDRIDLIEQQRRILRRIIPTYKKYQDEGKIEISTSPYYHPILPLLADMEDAQRSNTNITPPKLESDLYEDAVFQVKSALDMFERTFGKRPAGIWPSEHCVSEKTMGILQDLGVKWTISDEGVLEQSLKREFSRDFRGYLENPYDLCHSYEYKNGKEPISIIFRDAVFPNLIGFEYPNHDPVKAANDLYDRIKSIQYKLENSPDKNHLLTIAMDGENCWENYPADGTEFLETLYGLINSDEGLETVTVSGYLEKIKKTKSIKTIHPGSWINRDFMLWVGEPTKNLAWQYLDKTRQDLKEFEKEITDPQLLFELWREIYMAEGSDWFWWYGEPNDSGQDNLFDLLFRSHLKNVYKLAGKPEPEYLDTPLHDSVYVGSRYPRGEVENFELTGTNNDNWANAGCIEIPTTPTMQEKRFFNKIFFEHDKDNLYLRFDINSYVIDEEIGFKDFHQIYIYFKNASTQNPPVANIRTISKTENVMPLLKERFTDEVKMTFFRKLDFPAQFAKANYDNLWILQIKHGIEAVYKDFVEIKIPFNDLNIQKGETAEFFIVRAELGLVDKFYPRDTLLSVTRPVD